MNLIKPKKLKHGDTITFIAPSGNIEKEYVYNAKKYFENKGYKVKLSKNIFNKDRYMAGKDNERLDDLHSAFLDKETDCIICVRGGYGALRIINKIDYDIIKNNPKIFCGYSDISALSAMILKKTGLITFSSPMPKGDFQGDNDNEYTQSKFWQTICNNRIEISAPDLKVYGKGDTSGLLFGGNLSTIASLCGMDFVPDEKFIFFAEDINEPVYKIDKYFRQLLNNNDFKHNLNGIILGDFLVDKYPEQLEILFNEVAEELCIPVYGGYNISHSAIKNTIPYGAEATLENGKIIAEY